MTRFQNFFFAVFPNYLTILINLLRVCCAGVRDAQCVARSRCGARCVAGVVPVHTTVQTGRPRR